MLPGVLLAAAGTAFAGLAVMPASAAETSRVTAAQALAPVELGSPESGSPESGSPESGSPESGSPESGSTAPANLALMSALQKGSDIANTPPPPPPVPEERAPARASRDRPPTDQVAPADEQAAPAAEQARGGEFARPATGRVTSRYGRRWGRLHAGIDIAAGSGARISAAADGTVLSAGSENGYGRAVRITHADGTVTLYAHNSSLLVSKGDKVKAGQQIAREGMTGNVTGVHLHFEVHVNGIPVNPGVWLAKRGINDV